jgi:PAS domain S-box-containing protein
MVDETRPLGPRRDIEALRQSVRDSRADLGERHRIVDALFGATSPFRSVFENAPVGMTIVDTAGTGRLVDGNPALQAMLGYSAEELRAMSFVDFTHPDDVDRNLNLYRSVLSREIDRYAMDKRYVRRDGRIVRARLTGSPIRDSNNRPHFVVGVLQEAHEPAASATLTVCSFCKSVRSDEDWEPLESSLGRRFGMVFSHGFCPECVERHYGLLRPRGEEP